MTQTPSASPDPTLAALQRLIDVVAALRSPDGGCPWDLAQTPETLIPYVIEEAYEVVDAIRQGKPEAIADELGDLLLQVVLQAQIASEAQQFSLKDVAEGITQKLIRRHPHVFGEVTVADAGEVAQNWEQIKIEEERAAGTERLTPRLERYGRSLPPLTAALKISQKAAKAGFEWDSIDDVWDKFYEELEEFRQAIAHEPKANQQAELGDLFFTLVNLARWHDLDPAEALHSTNQRFVQRFGLVEDAILQESDRRSGSADRPRSLSDYSLEELEALWQTAKARLKQEQDS